MQEAPHPEVRTSDDAVAAPAPADVVAERAETYETWLADITKPQSEAGHAAVPLRSQPLHWTPLAKALGACTVALVSTGGVHRVDQEPFDVASEHGDWSWREIGGDAPTDELTVTHAHYATRDALDDVNVMFPLDRLRELADEGFIGGAAPRHAGLMGFIPDPRELVCKSAPEIAERLRGDGVDAVVLTGG